MINDHRNGSEYRCVVVLQGTDVIQRESSATILFITGKCDTSYISISLYNYTQLCIYSMYMYYEFHNVKSTCKKHKNTGCISN